MVGTTEQRESTAGGTETDGGQTVGPVGFAPQQTEGHSPGPCSGSEEGLSSGSESEEFGIGIYPLSRLPKSSSNSGSKSRRKDKRSWMNLPLIN
jgi:hypothetical protein